MTEYIYKVVTDDDGTYWVDDETSIIDSFGKVVEVTRFLLTNGVDITDSVNGGYLE